MAATSPKPYLPNSVTSKDGTNIGYLQFGSGPGLILVHGGLMTSKNFMKLAIALSGEYTVYVPDRRGRGMSGPHGDGYNLAKECEDVAALMAQTGAHYIFGLSSGAIVVLQSALTLSAISKIAVYEPPLVVDGSPGPLKWMARYERELAAGKLGAAMVSIIKGTADKDLMGILPRFILTPLMSMAIRASAKAGSDEASLDKLVPTMHYDAKLVAETKGHMDSFRDVKAEVLLMGGNRSIAYLAEALDALTKVLPHFSRVELAGIGHLAADNSGKPELVANELKRFFSR